MSKKQKTLKNNGDELVAKPDYKTFQTMDQLLGITFNSKYKTINLEEYEKQINGYSQGELSDHALTLNIKDQGDRPRLIKVLLDEFVSYTRPFRVLEGPKPIEQKTFGADIYKIMSAGK